ncbi:NAD(P)-dependent oxidoreductase [Janibacter indicus]
MRVLVIGGSGAAGSCVVAEAVRRGHDVVAAARSPRPGVGPARIVRLDVTDTAAVVAAAQGVDVIVGATRPAPGGEGAVVEMTISLAEAAARADARLVVIGGAAPLRVPGTRRRAMDDPRWVPAEFRRIAEASAQQLDLLGTADPEPEWTYLAPAADFRPGGARGTYRQHLGSRCEADLVVAADGTSRIAMEDFALAVCDEIEQPRVSRGVVAVGW